LVNSRYFSDVVRRLPDVPITLELSDSMELTIRYEKSYITLRTMDAADFPPFPAFKGGLDFQLSSETLKRLVRQTSFTASTDDLKAVFTGLLWEINGEEIGLVGTDTHRLSWSKGAINIENKEAKGNFIIPAKIAQEISRLIQDDACHIQAEKNTVFFTFDDIKIYCRVLEGSFPNYRKVIPEQYVTTIQAESKKMRDAVERISLFALSDGDTSTINLEIADSQLIIHSRSDVGFGREEMEIEQSGENLTIAFNSRYINDIFKVTDGDKISIQLSGKLSAGVMKDPSEKDFLYLVLPVRV
jgi:DNA polymerase-3 subunit beta